MIRTRMTGPGRYSGVDERGTHFTVGCAGPGLWTGYDANGERVSIRTTGPGRNTYSRHGKDEPEKRPAPKKRPQR